MTIGQRVLGFHHVKRMTSVNRCIRNHWRVSPYFIPGIISNLAPGHLSIRHNAKGPCITTTTACSSAAHAIGDAMRHIRHGDADLMIAGGADQEVRAGRVVMSKRDVEMRERSRVLDEVAEGDDAEHPEDGGRSARLQVEPVRGVQEPDPRTGVHQTD